MRRCIGLDIHREFAEVAVWQGGTVRSAGRIETTPEGLRLFAASLCERDEVALTCNRHAIARLLECHIGRVVVSNPAKTRAITETKTRRCWRGCWRLVSCLRSGCPTTRHTRSAARSLAGRTSSASARG